jgi:DNA helicase HerA-like ATPase
VSGHAVFRRDEFANAVLDLGPTTKIELADYATTGIRAVVVGPSGVGKTNALLVMAEQLAEQGWVSVLLDPEGELEELYGQAVRDPGKLQNCIRGRQHPILVARVKYAAEFILYAKAIMEVVDEERKPVFLVIDEAQIFSAPRKRKDDLGESADLMNDFVQRGRKRALDLGVTAHRFAGTLHRSVFANKNLTLVGRQEDPTAWSALAPQFKGSNIGFSDLAALSPGEFICFSRRGVEKIAMPMAKALEPVAMKATKVRSAIPATFSEWDRAMREIPTDRLLELSRDRCGLLGAIAGLSPQELAAGHRALGHELEARS